MAALVGEGAGVRLVAAILGAEDDATPLGAAPPDEAEGAALVLAALPTRPRLVELPCVIVRAVDVVVVAELAPVEA